MIMTIGEHPRNFKNGTIVLIQEDSIDELEYRHHKLNYNKYKHEYSMKSRHNYQIMR